MFRSGFDDTGLTFLPFSGGGGGGGSGGDGGGSGGGSDGGGRGGGGIGVIWFQLFMRMW